MGVLQIENVEQSDLNQYSILRNGKKGYKAKDVFAAGIKALTDGQGSQKVETGVTKGNADEVDVLNGEKKELNAKIEELNTDIADLEARIEELSSSDKDSEIEDRDSTIAALNEELEAANKKIAGFESLDGAGGGDAEALEILGQLASGGLTLAAFKKEHGEKYKPAE